MFESFGRGLKLILASIKMGFQDKRLLVPGILTVFSNFFFAVLLFLEGKSRVGATNVNEMVGGAVSGAKNLGPHAAEAIKHVTAHAGHGRHGLEMMAKPEAIQQFIGQTALNGPWDQSGMGALQAAATPDAILAVVAILVVWWLTNRFLEGVTTALVYSHLTEGAGTGKFSTACAAVFTSLPAIVALGFTTLIAKRVARFMRDKRGSGVFGMGVNFLASIVEVFWTLAGPSDFCPPSSLKAHPSGAPSNAADPHRSGQFDCHRRR